MEVLMPLTNSNTVHIDSFSHENMNEREQPLATTSSQDQPSDFQRDFYTGPIRRVQPQRQRHGRFGTHNLDEYIQKHIEREAQQRAIFPADTVLHFSTNSQLVPNSEEIIDQIDARFGLSKELPEITEDGDDFEIGSYFRTREVMHKIRRQQVIETPSFSEITEEDRQRAYATIPGFLLEEQVDRSDDQYFLQHTAPTKKETRVRVSETDKFKYRKHQLRDRIKQLNGLDASYFLGETMEEQEQNRAQILAAGNEILEQLDGTKGDDGSDVDDEGAAVDGYAGDRWPKVNGAHAPRKKHQPSAVEEGEAGVLLPVAPKPPKKERKKSTRTYYDASFGIEDLIDGNLNPYADDDEEHPRKHKKKPHHLSKKAANSGKRKRVVEVEGELEDEYAGYEQVEPPEPVVKKIKTEKGPRVRSVSVAVPALTAVKSEKASKLLEQARKYNPGRVSRDLHPFGVAFDSNIVEAAMWDFKLPFCVVGEEDEEESGEGGEDEEDGMEEHGPDAVKEEDDMTAEMDTMADAKTADSVLTEDIEGEEEIVLNGQDAHYTAGDSSSPLSSVDDPDHDE